HTNLVTVTPNGVTQSSKGDNLLLTFAPPPSTEKSAAKSSTTKADVPAAQPAAQLQSAVQLGNVTLVQKAASAPGGQTPAVTTATAQRAAYDAASQVMQLSGSPRIEQANGELSATLIDFSRTSGNADATGSVKATYRQGSGQQNNMAFTG